jgi:transposase-like protein
MEEISTRTGTDSSELFAGEAWFDPIEAGIRERVRGFIQELLEQELTTALGRARHERAGGEPKGYRNGTRERRLLGSFGPVQISVPRARMADADRGGTHEWRNATLPRYARMTRQVEALITGAYLAGTNTRRVKRALTALFGGAVGKDVVSRTWRKVRTDWEAWTKRDLTGEDVVRLILDGTVVRVRLDRKATNISLLVVLGVRRDGQKVLLAVKNMGGESEAAWRGILDDLVARGLRTPDFLITDGAAGLERAVASLWPDVPAQRCTVHKQRNLLAHAPDALHVALALSGRGGEPRGGRRPLIRLPPAALFPMEVGADHERRRATARGVQAPHQDADRAALCRNGRDAVLVSARIGPDHDAQSRRVADVERQNRGPRSG